MAALGEAVPGQAVWVIDASVLRWREGLVRLIEEVTPEMGRQIVLFGEVSDALKEAAREKKIVIEESNDAAVRAWSLIIEKPTADKFIFLGPDQAARDLARALDHTSMTVEPLHPETFFREIFLRLGIPEEILDLLNIDDLESELTTRQAA